jgi:hypothetical protein
LNETSILEIEAASQDLLSTQFEHQALQDIIFIENNLLQLQKCSVEHDNIFVSALG